MTETLSREVPVDPAATAARSAEVGGGRRRSAEVG